MWPLCSYCINLNISCWLIKKLSSKYNTSINLMTYFSSRITGQVRVFYPRKVALVWYVAVLGYLYLPRPNGKSRNQNPGPKLWRFRNSFRVGIRTFPNDYQHRWLFVLMVTNCHPPVEVYDTDRYQWPPGHHWWPLVVSVAEGRSPNARVDSAPCWRASTIEQLKWFREFSLQNAEYSFVLLEVTCSPLVNMQIFGN